MSYIIVNTHNGDIHRADDDEALLSIYEILVSDDGSVGSVEAFDEHCIVIKGGELVTLASTRVLEIMQVDNNAQPSTATVHKIPPGGGCGF